MKTKALWTTKPPILQTNRPPNNQKPHFWEPKKIDQSGKFLGGGAGLIFTQRFQKYNFISAFF